MLSSQQGLSLCRCPALLERPFKAGQPFRYSTTSPQATNSNTSYNVRIVSTYPSQSLESIALVSTVAHLNYNSRTGTDRSCSLSALQALQRSSTTGNRSVFSHFSHHLAHCLPLLSVMFCLQILHQPPRTCRTTCRQSMTAIFHESYRTLQQR